MTFFMIQLLKLAYTIFMYEIHFCQSPLQKIPARNHYKNCFWKPLIDTLIKNFCKKSLLEISCRKLLVRHIYKKSLPETSARNFCQFGCTNPYFLYYNMTFFMIQEVESII